VITNPGTVALSSVSVTDNECSTVTLLSGDTNRDSKLNPNETWKYSCKTNIRETKTNTAIATGKANGLTAIDTALITVLVEGSPAPPLIHIIKKPESLILPASGGFVTYIYTVTNPGTIPLNNASVSDDKCSPVTFTNGDTNGNSVLESNETWTYSCGQNIKASTTNTATATGHANGLTVTDVSIASVHVAPVGFPETGLALPSTGLSKPPVTVTLHRSLSLNMRGPDVVALQTVLEQKGFLKIPKGVKKGFFGALTRNAVAKYQKSVGLPSNGLFGPRTREKLIAELGE
jgi:hypothetical protein